MIDTNVHFLALLIHRTNRYVTTLTVILLFNLKIELYIYVLIDLYL